MSPVGGVAGLPEEALTAVPARLGQPPITEAEFAPLAAEVMPTAASGTPGSTAAPGGSDPAADIPAEA